MGFHKVKAIGEAESVEIKVSSSRKSTAHKVDPPLPSMVTRIEETVVSANNQHHYGQLYADNLRARKAVFIDQKSWDLPQTDGMEFDQYDTPQSRSVVIHEYGRVLAGVRLLPTTALWMLFIYASGCAAWVAA